MKSLSNRKIIEVYTLQKNIFIINYNKNLSYLKINDLMFMKVFFSYGLASACMSVIFNSLE
jgi:hypothetical protein